MKKFLFIGLLSLCVVYFTACPAETFAKTKQIVNTVQTELSYKETMEQIINTGIPIIKTQVNELYHKVEHECMSVSVRSINDLDMWDTALSNAEMYRDEIDAVCFNFYEKLIKKTEAMIGLPGIIPTTSSSKVLADFIEPVLVDNDINLNKLDELNRYISSAQKNADEFISYTYAEYKQKQMSSFSYRKRQSNN